MAHRVTSSRVKVNDIFAQFCPYANIDEGQAVDRAMNWNDAVSVKRNGSPPLSAMNRVPASVN
jgi:hypothetical protein